MKRWQDFVKGALKGAAALAGIGVLWVGGTSAQHPNCCCGTHVSTMHQQHMMMLTHTQHMQQQQFLLTLHRHQQYQQMLQLMRTHVRAHPLVLQKQQTTQLSLARHKLTTETLWHRHLRQDERSTELAIPRGERELLLALAKRSNSRELDRNISQRRTDHPMMLLAKLTRVRHEERDPLPTSLKRTNEHKSESHKHLQVDLQMEKQVQTSSRQIERTARKVVRTCSCDCCSCEGDCCCDDEDRLSLPKLKKPTPAPQSFPVAIPSQPLFALAFPRTNPAVPQAVPTPRQHPIQLTILRQAQPTPVRIALPKPVAPQLTLVAPGPQNPPHVVSPKARRLARSVPKELVTQNRIMLLLQPFVDRPFQVAVTAENPAPTNPGKPRVKEPVEPRLALAERPMPAFPDPRPFLDLTLPAVDDDPSLPSPQPLQKSTTKPGKASSSESDAVSPKNELLLPALRAAAAKEWTPFLPLDSTSEELSDTRSFDLMLAKDRRTRPDLEQRVMPASILPEPEFPLLPATILLVPTSQGSREG